MPVDSGRSVGQQAAIGLLCVLLVSACSALAVEPSAVHTARSGPADEATGLSARVTGRSGDRLPLPTSDPPRDATPWPSPQSSPVPSAFPVPSAGPAPSASPARPEPRVRVIRLKPRPRPGPFRIDLYRPGDFVHQQTKDWCVAGSTQTMMNIIARGRPNRSAAFQEHLYLKGRRLSPNKRKLGPIGVDLTGWAELLDRGGYGPYAVDGAGTRRAAIHKAARALRLTGRPVGLVTWRGAHSWVMSGFTATADPAYSRRYRVTAVYIQDVWYPYVSTIWGASRPPGALVPVAALAVDYLPYQRPRARWPARDGRFMLVLPELPRNTVVR